MLEDVSPRSAGSIANSLSERFLATRRNLIAGAAGALAIATLPDAGLAADRTTAALPKQSNSHAGDRR